MSPATTIQRSLDGIPLRASGFCNVNQLFEALAHPTRREILELLKTGSMSAGEIARRFDVSKPTLSGHFAKLKEAQANSDGLVKTEVIAMNVWLPDVVVNEGSVTVTEVPGAIDWLKTVGADKAPLSTR